MASMVYVTLAPANDSIRDFRPAGSTGLIVTTTTRTLHRAWEGDLFEGLCRTVSAVPSGCNLQHMLPLHGHLTKLRVEAFEGCGRTYHMLMHVGRRSITGTQSLCCWTKALPTMTGIAAPLIANSAYTFTICIAMACASSACRVDSQSSPGPYLESLRPLYSREDAILYVSMGS